MHGGYLRLTTPIYNISATVLIKDEKKGGGASMSSDLEKMGLEGFVSSSSNVDNEIEVLRSKVFVQRGGKQSGTVRDLYG